MTKALRLFGVVRCDGETVEAPAGVQIVVVRALAAAVEPGDAAREPAPRDVQRYREVVDALFATDAVVPAPLGTTFKSQDVLQRWLDVHYVALSDALAWVEHRVAARVHVRAASAHASAAADALRQLASRTVASLTLPSAAEGTLSTAYLVEREVWPAFAAAVAQVNERHTELSAEATGPWPPYDFVRLQLAP